MTFGEKNSLDFYSHDFGHKFLTSSIRTVELHSKNLVQLRDRVVYNGHSDELEPLPWKKVQHAL